MSFSSASVPVGFGLTHRGAPSHLLGSAHGAGNKHSTAEDGGGAVANSVLGRADLRLLSGGDVVFVHGVRPNFGGLSSLGVTGTISGGSGSDDEIIVEGHRRDRPRWDDGPIILVGSGGTVSGGVTTFPPGQGQKACQLAFVFAGSGSQGELDLCLAWSAGFDSVRRNPMATPVADAVIIPFPDGGHVTLYGYTNAGVYTAPGMPPVIPPGALFPVVRKRKR